MIINYNYLTYKLKVIFEDPSSSIAGRIMAGLSVFFILISTVSFCLETLPQFRDGYEEKGFNSSSTGPVTAMKKPWDPSRKSFPFWVTESICIAFFTFEFVARVCTSTAKWLFVCQFGNIIDILSVIPYYVTIGVEIIFMGQKVAFLPLLRVIRLLSYVDVEYINSNKSIQSGLVTSSSIKRVFRIAKLGRHNQNLTRLVRTIKGSSKEFNFLFLLFAVFMIIFSSLVYYAENNKNPKLDSIPGTP